MAIFIPSLERISEWKVPPTPGEKCLLRFLCDNLDDSFEVYFNPMLNGDRPDVIIMRKGYGVMIIEVKDWNLNNYHLDAEGHLILNSNGTPLKSPIAQALQYKENLYNLHIPQLLQQKIINPQNWAIVTCAVYFHCANQSEVDNFFRQGSNYYDLIGYDKLEREAFYGILRKRYLMANYPSILFTEEIYDNFRRILFPSVHLGSDKQPKYTNDQKKIVYSDKIEQRAKGVFGSGKTTALAGRAVEAYKRSVRKASKGTPQILILTFNITLRNLIHDKLNQVDEKFNFNDFTILNYHEFIKMALNNIGIPVKAPRCYEVNVPCDRTKCLINRSECETFIEYSKTKAYKEAFSSYMEKRYFSNLNLFERHRKEFEEKLYNGVIIDEVQDYKRQWLDIIKKYFRNPNGDYVLFSDVKQNIYERDTDDKDVITNIKGRPNNLRHCFRSANKIIDLAHDFQKCFLSAKYDVDVFERNWFFGFSPKREGYIKYIYLPNAADDVIPDVYDIIRDDIVNKKNVMSPNDITILGFTIKTLRRLDCYYRYSCRERTNTMFETIECMYLMHINQCQKCCYDNSTSYGGRCRPHINQCQKCCYDNGNCFSIVNDTLLNEFHKCWYNEAGKMLCLAKAKPNVILAQLFAIYDMNMEYGGLFGDRLKEECNKHRITIDEFSSFMNRYSLALDKFRTKVYQDNYEIIRRNKKLHFWMNSGTIKISTVHSFKGWESETAYVVLEKTPANPETLYTGITRARKNLVIINVNDDEYHKFFMEKVGSEK